MGQISCQVLLAGNGTGSSQSHWQQQPLHLGPSSSMEPRWVFSVSVNTATIFIVRNLSATRPTYFWQKQMGLNQRISLLEFATIVHPACLIHKAPTSINRERSILVCLHDLLLFILSLHLSYSADRPETLGCHCRTSTVLQILESETWGGFSLAFGSGHYLHRYQP